MNKVLYICDRKRCNPCDNELCQYTTDIDHAVNFQKDREGNYWECIGVMLENGGNHDIEKDNRSEEKTSRKTKPGGE